MTDDATDNGMLLAVIAGCALVLLAGLAPLGCDFKRTTKITPFPFPAVLCSEWKGDGPKRWLDERKLEEEGACIKHGECFYDCPPGERDE